MNTEIKKIHGFEPLEEAQLVQQFQVEELEKRYEFGWGGTLTTSAGYTEKGGVEFKVSYSHTF